MSTRIESRFWYIDENRLCRSLMNYFVEINMIFEDGLHWEVNFIKDCEIELSYCFDTLEKAVAFVEENKNIKEKPKGKIYVKSNQ